MTYIMVMLKLIDHISRLESVYVLAWQIVKVDVCFPFDLKTSLECYKKYYQIDCPVYKESLRCFLIEAAA